MTPASEELPSAHESAGTRGECLARLTVYVPVMDERLALVIAPMIGPWQTAGPGPHPGTAQHGSSATPSPPLFVGCRR